MGLDADAWPARGLAAKGMMRIREESRDSGGFTLVADDGTGPVGLIQISRRGFGPMVSWIEVAPDLRRSGIATRLYEVAAREACARWGQPLRSDVTRREGAESFWQKQAAKGRAEYHPVSRQYVLTCPAPASLASARKGSKAAWWILPLLFVLPLIPP